MKKKLAALLCTFALALALPGMAFADTFTLNSPSALMDRFGTSDNGVTAFVSFALDGTSDFEMGATVNVEGTSEVASNVPSGVTPIASFKVTSQGVTFTSATITFNVGTQYAGQAVTIFIQHGDGGVEAVSDTATSDGIVTATVDRFSIFSIALGSYSSESSSSVATTTVATDTSTTSPKTGIDNGLVAGGVAVCFVGAACVAWALRRKVAE